MAMPFANSDGRVHPDRLRSYLSGTSPESVGAAMPGWQADPTDLLALADVACSFGYKEHGLEFYRFALGVFERYPTAAAADTNLSGGYTLYAKTLLELHRPWEAVAPLAAAVRLSPRDASIWRLLGLAQAICGSLDEAVASMEAALRLEGIDRRQPAAFYQSVRESLGRIREQRAESGAQQTAMGTADAEIDSIDAARRYLAARGITFDGRRVLVPCQKPAWREPQTCEVCKVEQDGETYTVLVDNLPYFFGERWQEESGGGPVMWEGGSVADVVNLVETWVVARMVKGVLPVA